MNDREYYFQSISSHFREWANPFDQSTRLAWFTRNLAQENLSGKKVLEVGAGLGEVSQWLKKSGAQVFPLDIAKDFAKQLKSDLGQAIQASATKLPFADEVFDFVVSSECIEHTTNPLAAVHEMQRVLKPQGKMLLTTPNLLWKWSVILAKWLGIRKFKGLENWVSRRLLRRQFLKHNFQIILTEGLYILPFQFQSLHPLIVHMNRHGQWAKGAMINQCWVAQKASLSEHK